MGLQATQHKIKHLLEFRAQHNLKDFVMGGEDRGGVTIVRQENPLRIDKLLANGIIDEMQHHYGIQLITLHTIVGRQFLKGMTFGEAPLDETDKSIIADIAENGMLGRMDAESQFRIILQHLQPQRNYQVIRAICFEELGAIKACAKAGIKYWHATNAVREAFDALGEAIIAMRKIKKGMDKI